MVERAELITVCRQIGGMMEAGVDILRVTRVLRAQTENPRLLELYDALDHDLKMGRSLADAIERAPDVFSPFAVSLVQQGEEANDLAGAFLKFADFLQQEEALAQHSAAAHGETSDSNLSGVDFPTAERLSTQHSHHIASDGRTTDDSLSRATLDELFERLQTAGLSALWLLSCLLLCLAGVCAMAQVGWLQRQWLSVALPIVAALFLAATGVGLRLIITQRHIVTEQRVEESPKAQSLKTSNDNIAQGPHRKQSKMADQAVKLESQRSSERGDGTSTASLQGAGREAHSARNEPMAARPASTLSEEDYE